MVSPFPDDPNVFDFLCHNISGSITSTKERERERKWMESENAGTHTRTERHWTPPMWIESANDDSVDRVQHKYRSTLYS